MRRAALLSTLAVLAATACPAAPAAGEAERLERLVRQDCGSCHGLTLKGGLGPAITPEAMARYDDDTLAEIILDGVPETPMPPWRPLLRPGEVEWIVDYLKGGSAQ